MRRVSCRLSEPHIGEQECVRGWAPGEGIRPRPDVCGHGMMGEAPAGRMGLGVGMEVAPLLPRTRGSPGRSGRTWLWGATVARAARSQRRSRRSLQFARSPRGCGRQRRTHRTWVPALPGGALGPTARRAASWGAAVGGGWLLVPPGLCLPGTVSPPLPAPYPLHPCRTHFPDAGKSPRS